MEPTYVGSYLATYDALSSALKNEKYSSGLYWARIYEEQYAEYPDREIYFWRKDSGIEFCIIKYLSQRLLQFMKNAIDEESGSYDPIFISPNTFHYLFIETPHPARDWLLFNADLWSAFRY
jgi:hypothetical protein